MQNINKKLTQLIDQKGFQKILDQIKKNWKDFKNRPDSVKINTYDKEIKNNENLIVNLTKELENLEICQKRMDSTALLQDLRHKQHKIESQIKKLKQEV